MMNSLALLVVLYTVHTAAMFEDEIYDLNSDIKNINGIQSVPNTPANGYQQINNAFENSGSYGQSKGNIFDNGNIVYSGPDSRSYGQAKGSSFDTGNMVFGGIPVVVHAAAVKGYQAPRACRIPAEASSAYHLQSHAYSYPKQEIYTELYNRPQARAAILGIRQVHRSVSSSAAVYSDPSVGAGGCKARTLNLGRFYAYGGQCWVINPAYQSVPYVSCGKGCGYDVGGGSGSYCAAYHVQTYVWAYCEGLRYGARIQPVALPLPRSCSCKTYQC